jgi:hypothetical protein
MGLDYPFGGLNQTGDKADCDDTERDWHQQHRQQTEIPGFVWPEEAVPNAGQKGTNELHHTAASDPASQK